MTSGSKRELILSLKKEHKEMLSEINSLEKILRRFQDGYPASKSVETFFKRLLVLEERFIQHMRREEQSLYSVLRLYVDGEMVKLMLEDHRRVAEDLGQGRSAFNGEASVSSEFRSRLSRVFSLKKEHLEKEEDVIFWLAEVKLGRSADVSTTLGFEDLKY